MKKVLFVFVSLWITGDCNPGGKFFRSYDDAMHVIKRYPYLYKVDIAVVQEANEFCSYVKSVEGYILPKKQELLSNCMDFVKMQNITDKKTINFFCSPMGHYASTEISYFNTELCIYETVNYYCKIVDSIANGPVFLKDMIRNYFFGKPKLYMSKKKQYFIREKTELWIFELNITDDQPKLFLTDLKTNMKFDFWVSKKLLSYFHRYLSLKVDECMAKNGDIAIPEGAKLSPESLPMTFIPRLRKAEILYEWEVNKMYDRHVFSVYQF